MSTILAIPCTPGGDQSNWVQRTQLDGIDYIVRFLWSQRDGHWSIDIADQDEVPIASGLTLVTGQSLLAGCVDPRKPAGTLVVVDTLNLNDLDPGFDDLAGRFVLAYVSPV